jgi:hypothetical protein
MRLAAAGEPDVTGKLLKGYSAGGKTAKGPLRVWSEPFVALRMPKLFNLRTDPFERADVTSNTYYDWLIHHGYILMSGSTMVGEFLATFKEFPPRQRPGSFTIVQAVEGMRSAGGGGDTRRPRVCAPVTKILLVRKS